MNRHELYFNCTCECGNKRVVKYLYLKNGHNKSCGCKRGQIEPGAIERDDLTGQTFGLWTVLHRDTSRTDIPFYICRCACGTERSVNKYNLRTLGSGTVKFGISQIWSSSVTILLHMSDDIIRLRIPH